MVPGLFCLITEDHLLADLGGGHASRPRQRGEVPVHLLLVAEGDGIDAHGLLLLSYHALPG